MAKEAISTGSLFSMLAIRFAETTGFSLLAEVGNRTGFQCSRHADAVAISLWPSRGQYLHGIEIKRSRADWLRELRAPAKAEAIAKYCRFWSLVVSDAGIVKDGELPATWGLMVARGGKLFEVTKPTVMEPAPITMTFFCALVRRFADGMTPTAAIQATIDQAYARGVKWGKEGLAMRVGHHQKQYKDLLEQVESFEQISGISTRRYEASRIAEAVKVVMTKPATIRRELVGMLGNMNSEIVILEAAIEQCPVEAPKEK